MTHDWKPIFSTGADEPGRSLDTIEQCAQCGALRHDYRHNGGQTSPNYPRTFKYGAMVPNDAECLGLLGAARSTLPNGADRTGSKIAP